MTEGAVKNPLSRGITRKTLKTVGKANILEILRVCITVMLMRMIPHIILGTWFFFFVFFVGVGGWGGGVKGPLRQYFSL